MNAPKHTKGALKATISSELEMFRSYLVPKQRTRKRLTGTPLLLFHCLQRVACHTYKNVTPDSQAVLLIFLSSFYCGMSASYLKLHSGVALYQC